MSSKHVYACPTSDRDTHLPRVRALCRGSLTSSCSLNPSSHCLRPLHQTCARPGWLALFPGHFCFCLFGVLGAQGFLLAGIRGFYVVLGIEPQSAACKLSIAFPHQHTHMLSLWPHFLSFGSCRHAHEDDHSGPQMGMTDFLILSCLLTECGHL